MAPDRIRPDSSGPTFLSMSGRDIEGALVLGLSLARAALVLVLPLLLASSFSGGLPREIALSAATPRAIALGIMGGVWLSALLYVLLTWKKAARSAEGLTQGVLFTGAIIDGALLHIGLLATTGAVVPFPPLIVLTVFVYGVLLSPWRTGIVTMFYGAAFALLTALISLLPPVQTPLTTADAQAALFVALGVVAAIVGSRFRAASWAMRSLRSAMGKVVREQQSAFAALPIGIVQFNELGEPVSTNDAALTMLRARVTESRPIPSLAVLERRIPGLAAAVAALCEGGDDDAGNLGVMTGGEVEVGRGEQRRVLAWQCVRHSAPALQSLAPAVLLGPHSSTSDAPSEDLVVRFESVVLLVITDLTDRLTVGLAQRRATQAEAMTAIAAGVAHEVRNPVAAIRSAAESLAEPEHLTPEDESTLRRIVMRESDRLNVLVSDFLEFARDSAPEMELSAPVDTARHAVAVVRSRLGPDVLTKFDIDVPDDRVWMDDGAIHQVLTNLVLNAAQASPDDGNVRIEARLRGGELHWSVTDNGPGVQAEDTGRIFSPFFTTRRKGTGLGLAVARRAAERAEGRLWLDESHLGGARFCFSHPARESIG